MNLKILASVAVLGGASLVGGSYLINLEDISVELPEITEEDTTLTESKMDSFVDGTKNAAKTIQKLILSVIDYMGGHKVFPEYENGDQK